MGVQQGTRTTPSNPFAALPGLCRSKTRSLWDSLSGAQRVESCSMCRQTGLLWLPRCAKFSEHSLWASHPQCSVVIFNRLQAATAFIVTEGTGDRRTSSGLVSETANLAEHFRIWSREATPGC